MPVKFRDQEDWPNARLLVCDGSCGRTARLAFDAHVIREYRPGEPATVTEDLVRAARQLVHTWHAPSRLDGIWRCTVCGMNKRS